MFLDKFKLDGKIAHITGGAKGIGLSIAHALGEAGAKLVLTDRKNTNVGVEELKKLIMMFHSMRETCLINQFPKKLLITL